MQFGNPTQTKIIPCNNGMRKRLVILLELRFECFANMGSHLLEPDFYTFWCGIKIFLIIFLGFWIPLKLGALCIKLGQSSGTSISDASRAFTCRTSSWSIAGKNFAFSVTVNEDPRILSSKNKLVFIHQNSTSSKDFLSLDPEWILSYAHSRLSLAARYAQFTSPPVVDSDPRNNRNSNWKISFLLRYIWKPGCQHCGSNLTFFARPFLFPGCRRRLPCAPDARFFFGLLV